MRTPLQLFAPLSLVAILSFTAAGDSSGTPTAATDSVSPSPQRHGDAQRGYRYLVEGDYVRSGPPLALFGNSARRTEEGLNRSGDNARLPYYLSVSTAPNGVRVVTPNCLQCHALWLLRKKHAMFYTGVGRGDFAKLMMAVSLLTLGNVDEVSEMESHFVDLLAWIRQLDPPPWPGPLDNEVAARGERLFVERCAGCHGTHGRQESYPNRLVDLSEVGTDPLLAEEQFTVHAVAVEAFNRSWFAQPPHAAKLVPQRGYLAPPLDGVWATAPYLHNGSVPTLMDLLDSSRRPTYWKRRRRSGDYDLEDVGLRYKRRKWQANKYVYDTTLPGYGNRGHTLGDSLTGEERRALLEYLKTL